MTPQPQGRSRHSCWWIWRTPKAKRTVPLALPACQKMQKKWLSTYWVLDTADMDARMDILWSWFMTIIFLLSLWLLCDFLFSSCLQAPNRFFLSRVAVPPGMSMLKTLTETIMRLVPELTPQDLSTIIWGVLGARGGSGIWIPSNLKYCDCRTKF